MSRQPHRAPSADDFFSHQALVLSFRILQNNHPELAKDIKHTLSTTPLAPYESFRGMHTGEMHFTAEIYQALSAHTIGKIVSALTALGESALANPHLPHEYIALFRGLIDDWVKLTEWILLLDANCNKVSFH